MVLVQFLSAAAIVAVSGTILTKYADRLADKLGISSALIGLLLLSFITSLPELGATISVVWHVGKPNIAAGNIFGSNTFNILIIAVMDFMIGSASLYAISKVSHTKSALLAMLMTAVSICAITFGGIGIFGDRIGAETLALLAVYVGGVYFIFKEEKESGHHPAEAERESVVFEAGVVFASGVCVVLAGYWLANVSDEIELVTGWGESFVGYIFLAIATSLPELVVSVTAVRLKAYDMAVANIFGSCFFNILMFTLADPFYHAPLLGDVSSVNIGLAAVSFVMLGVAGAAFAAGRRGMRSGMVKWIIIALYLLGSFVIFSPG
ncbi:MAG: cation transporter [bacterium]|nr:MAG: cation transporter [bacterium]